MKEVMDEIARLSGNKPRILEARPVDEGLEVIVKVKLSKRSAEIGKR